MKLAWFHPKTVLDKVYEIGLVTKGIDGTVELIAGILVLSLSPGFILRVTSDLVSDELNENPHNYIALHVLHSGQKLAAGHNFFAAAFLLTHGLVKIILVICLLLNKIWVYPYAIGILVLFLVYQIYALITAPGIGMALLSVLDAAIIWLVWREWQQVRRNSPRPVKRT
jgi:uncharacterized membrane protein